MSHLFELKQQLKEVSNRKEALWGKRSNLTAEERLDYQAAYAQETDLQLKINEREAQNTILRHRPEDLMAGGAPEGRYSRSIGEKPKQVFSQDYMEAFFSMLGTYGQKIDAALYEGVGSAGGFAVPVIVEGQVVPLAPTDTGVRSIATVIPTSSDIKVPRATTISTTTAKAEGTGSGANLFTESEPVLDQFTLSAFMAGVLHQISWELAQDVPSFQSFAVGDMLLAQEIYEENLFVNGTGSGQAQGLIGNVGAGVSANNVITAGSGDSFGSALIDATFDVMGTLKTAYHKNASWLMSRATSTFIRKAQKQANLFEPVFVREGGRDYLHGYPVVYSTAMPTYSVVNNVPILFGDFATGYVIGDRGGSGINIKILDQPKAVEGLIQLLAYRRMDGRVRRSEAIQGITIAS